MPMTKSYYNKAKDYICLNRSTLTRNFEQLKREALIQKRTAFEFCIWYDFKLVDVANLNTGVFSCILELIGKNYIHVDKQMKSFRLACIIFDKFMRSDKTVNDSKCEEYKIDYPDIVTRLNTKIIAADFSSYLDYDRVSANKLIFPFFRSRKISTNLIAELISRQFLAFDDEFHNLIFICKTDKKILGVEKLGIGKKHFQKIEGLMPICWCYWAERDESVYFDIDIKKAIFFDTTIRLLQHITDNYPEEGVLYCSLHTEGCLIETYINTLGLLCPNVKIDFNFENYKVIDKFRNSKKENNILLEVPTPKAETVHPSQPIVEEFRDTSNMTWVESEEAFYDETDETYWNIDGSEALPF